VTSSRTPLDQLRRAVDHIEEHLDEDVAIEQVARTAAMSRWHFQRTFKAATGDTVMAYVRGRRLSRALDRLAGTDMRIADIAQLAGFESQESFTRAFRGAFGITPHRFRALGRTRLFLRKARFDEQYLRHLVAHVDLDPVVEHRPADILVGLRTTFHGTDSEKNSIAERLPPLWDRFLDRAGEVPHRVPGAAYGMIRPVSPDDDCLEYVAAFAVHHAGRVPPGMVRFYVPTATYARFTHRGPATGMDRTVDYVYSTWLLRSGMRHTGGPDLEIYRPDHDGTDPANEVGYAIPVAPALEWARPVTTPVAAG
jgi:AraC family transcriptional regulator